MADSYTVKNQEYVEILKLLKIVKLVASADIRRRQDKENLAAVNAVHVNQQREQAHYPPAQNYGRGNYGRGNFRRGNGRAYGNNQRAAPYNRNGGNNQRGGFNQRYGQQQVNDGPKCNKCNFNEHARGELCPAAGARCNHCHDTGHYKRCCPRKNQVGWIEDDWSERLN